MRRKRNPWLQKVSLKRQILQIPSPSDWEKNKTCKTLRIQFQILKVQSPGAITAF